MPYQKIGTIKLENYVHIHCSNIGYVESHILNILKIFLSVRRIFTKLRESCHKLEIELGRYKKKYKHMQDYVLYVNWKLKRRNPFCNKLFFI